MTTLFSIFSPIFVMLSVKWAVVFLVGLSLILWYWVVINCFSSFSGKLALLSTALFSSKTLSSIVLFSLFFSLSTLNLTSFFLYSYPVTTSLGFNLSASMCCWLSGVLIQMVKTKTLSSLLPLNTPWYLVPFLCLVELISILVRPVTLCFRLLANMVAGHVLLALIAKVSFIWSIGSLFGILELMVAIVQAFVFSMLISVYLEEAFSH